MENERAISKYNHRYVIEFVQNRAEQRFLAPLGLALKCFPSANFGNNCNRMNYDKQFELFTALHYMKYKITKTKMTKCRNRYFQIYMALRNRGVSANYRLVLDCVKRYREKFSKGRIDEAHTIEHGYMSLIHAVEGFDPWMGYRFSTYACNAITRSFFNRAQIVRYIMHIDDVGEIEIKLNDKNQDLWIERMELLLQSDRLNTREREVLIYRFYDKLTLKEVGVIWGLTKERVRQIQKKALLNMKNYLNKDPIMS